MRKENQVPAITIRAYRAACFMQRARGLLFTKTFPKEFDGLFIVPCSGVHTLGMRYKIDVVFINKHLRVIQVNRSVKPWKLFVMCRSAYGVLELKEDASLSMSRGQQLHLNYVKS